MSETNTSALDKLKRGYAILLDAHPTLLDDQGLHYVVSAVREKPEWANWVYPIWFVRIDSAIVCSIAPKYADTVRRVFGARCLRCLVTPDLLILAQQVIEMEGWIQREILYYPALTDPKWESSLPVERLRPGTIGADSLLRAFDGGVYVIRAREGEVVAHAGIKDKGLIQEIAVGTEVSYRKRGFGRAVVSAAVTAILKEGKVPVYVPDTSGNLASYALARSVGFKPAGDTLFWEYEIHGWPGFAVPRDIDTQQAYPPDGQE